MPFPNPLLAEVKFVLFLAKTKPWTIIVLLHIPKSTHLNLHVAVSLPEECVHDHPRHVRAYLLGVQEVGVAEQPDEDAAAALDGRRDDVLPHDGDGRPQTVRLVEQLHHHRWGGGGGGGGAVKGNIEIHVYAYNNHS